MIAAAGQNGWVDQDKVMMETLAAFKRAGCDGVLTYFAPQVARACRDGQGGDSTVDLGLGRGRLPRDISGQ